MFVYLSARAGREGDRCRSKGRSRGNLTTALHVSMGVEGRVIALKVIEGRIDFEQAVDDMLGDFCAV